MATEENLASVLLDRLAGFTPGPVGYARGRVLSCADGIVSLSDMDTVQASELVRFESGACGIVLNLEPGHVGVAVFADHDRIQSGEEAYGTGQVLRVPVGPDLLGRVINPLGMPLDARGPVHAAAYMPIEAPAHGIIERSAVNRPLETGILAIDSMVPIGRGQRELIIGDRQTGKTSIAIDAIINQKGKHCSCIYVAIGQKASKVAEIEQILRENQAMAYTAIVCATSADNASLQYICPYAAATLGEYFMNNGQDCLIVYDDLSKHAVSYRTISLLLRRPPGREAYPGDVFYLHSRLLERSAQLSADNGGGSLTALPIIETMAGDISAYIPTNVISITDGQIYLDTEMFRAGQRPAVNVGLSVSRVGGSAQHKSVRKLSGRMRLDLAQFHELAVFARFGSDLDQNTRDQLAKGERLTQALKQPRYTRYSFPEQALLLYVLGQNLCAHVAPEDINAYVSRLFYYIHTTAPEVFNYIDTDDEISPLTAEKIVSCIAEFEGR